MTFEAGRYRHRIRIEERVEEKNTFGETEFTWEVLALDSHTDLEEVPAEVLTGAGRERVAAGQERGEGFARINFRWFEGLKYSHRIIWNGVVYDIRSIETDVTARREYRVLAQAHNGAA